MKKKLNKKHDNKLYVKMRSVIMNTIIEPQLFTISRSSTFPEHSSFFQVKQRHLTKVLARAFLVFFAFLCRQTPGAKSPRSVCVNRLINA